MIVKKAEFVISSTKVYDCPKHNLPEYAFIGRSNVGKSSLINALTNNSKLAKTSQKPGKTLLINHFFINNSWYLVDLPGYGFADVGKTMMAKLDVMIKGYVLNRRELTNLFVLIDCRHDPQPKDVDFLDFLGANSVPFSIVFTKSDKLSNAVLQNNLKKYKEFLLEKWEELPPIFVTSSLNKTGLEPILEYINQINNDINKESSEK